jgi:hypothetical protein
VNTAIVWRCPACMTPNTDDMPLPSRLLCEGCREDFYLDDAVPQYAGDCGHQGEDDCYGQCDFYKESE